MDQASAFSNNQGAATALAHRKLTHKGGNLLDRVVCDFHGLTEHMPLTMGWCPGQHDTKLNGVPAWLNKREDKRAKQARVRAQSDPWTMPLAWVDGHMFAWYYRGRRVMGIKQAVRDTVGRQRPLSRAMFLCSMCETALKTKSCASYGHNVRFDTPANCGGPASSIL